MKLLLLALAFAFQGPPPPPAPSIWFDTGWIGMTGLVNMTPAPGAGGTTLNATLPASTRTYHVDAVLEIQYVVLVENLTPFTVIGGGGHITTDVDIAGSSFVPQASTLFPVFDTLGSLGPADAAPGSGRDFRAVHTYRTYTYSGAQTPVGNFIPWVWVFTGATHMEWWNDQSGSYSPDPADFSLSCSFFSARVTGYIVPE